MGLYSYDEKVLDNRFIIMHNMISILMTIVITIVMIHQYFLSIIEIKHACMHEREREGEGGKTSMASQCHSVKNYNLAFIDMSIRQFMFQV